MNMPENSIEPSAIVASFKQLYQDLNAQTVASGLIEATYSDDMCFEDCFHKVEGLAAFREHCESLYQNVRDIRFEFHDELIETKRAMLTWSMYYRHPHLNWGREIKVEGASLIRFEHKITLHRDYFDGGELLYEQVPLLGSLISGLKKRVGA